MSKIEWTERTWNPTGGCTIVSPGCTHCYAMRTAARGHLRDHPKYAGTTTTVKGNPVWTGTVRIGDDKAFREPLTVRTPTMWFVNSMSDLFHEGIPDAVIDRVFAIMALCPQHTFQVLTKRADRMREYLSSNASLGRVIAAAEAERAARRLDASLALSQVEDGHAGFMLPNVWLGVSVEDQARADARIPALLDTPAAVRFVSAEPLLGRVDLGWVGKLRSHGKIVDALKDDPALDWVIVGGESGPGARECDLAHIRAIVEQCAAADVPVFVKQIGARAMLGSHRWGTVNRKGGNPADWSKALRVRQMPGGVA